MVDKLIYTFVYSNITLTYLKVLFTYFVMSKTKYVFSHLGVIPSLK